MSLLASSTYENKPLTLELVKEAVGVIYSSTNKISVQEIISKVCEIFRINEEDLIGTSRKKVFTIPRHLAIYCARKFTPLTLEKIGESFGNRDHATIRYSCEQLENHLLVNETLRNHLSEMTYFVENR